MSEQLITTYERMRSAQKQAYVRGIFAERERIIELLEDNCECDLDYCCLTHRIIHLIKGETDNED